MLSTLTIQTLEFENNRMQYVVLFDELFKLNLSNELRGDEKQIYSNMQNPRRRCQFAVGRWLARRVMSQTDSIGRDVNNMPQWPLGWRGSIAHRDHVVVVSAAKTTELIGVDVEKSKVSTRLAPKILGESEEAAFGRLPGDPEINLARIFSAKESFYKAVYPEFRKVFGFHDVEFSDWEPTSMNLRICNADLAQKFKKTMRCEIKNLSLSGEDYIVSLATEKKYHQS